MRHATNRFFALVFAAVIIICTFAGCAEAEKTGKVHGGWLILRSDPSYKGRRLSSYPTGTVVTITGQSGKWYAVKAPDGLRGYMLGSYLTVSGDDIVMGEDAWVTSTNGLNVKMRSGAGTEYKAIASYPPGTKCKVIFKYGDFTYIQIGSLLGYMMTQFLTGTDPGSGGTVEPYDVYVVSPNGTGVNLRSGPSKGNQAIGFYEVGTKGKMIRPGAVWSLITIEGRTGYMMSQFLSKTAPEPYVPTGEYIVISYNGKNINMRSGPGKNYPVIRTFPPGTSLKILTVGRDWQYISIGEIKGYMMTQFIRRK